MPGQPAHPGLQLPKNIIRITPCAGGIELYFPPLRAPGTAAALGLFGVICMVLPLMAASTLLTAGGNAAHGLLVIALVGSVIVPFPVFGALFIVFAVYLLANSLTVTVTVGAIRSVRRVFGIQMRQREIKCRDIRAVEERVAAKYQNLFRAQSRFQLIARHDDAPLRRDVVVAESLEGEAMTTQVHGLIARHAGLRQHHQA